MVKILRHREVKLLPKITQPGLSPGNKVGEDNQRGGKRNIYAGKPTSCLGNTAGLGGGDVWLGATTETWCRTRSVTTPCEHSQPACPHVATSCVNVIIIPLKITFRMKWVVSARRSLCSSAVANCVPCILSCPHRRGRPLLCILPSQVPSSSSDSWGRLGFKSNNRLT